MGSPELRAISTRFLPGYAFRLAERTALVGLECLGAERFDAAAESRVRAAFWELCPQERIYALPECRDDSVPGVLLIDDDADREDPLWRLGRWVAALTVALHRWAHLPIIRGRVVHAEGGSLWLALPWATEPMLTSSLDMALRLLAVWADPDATVERDELEAEFRSGLDNLHHDAPPLEWLRFAQAAAARDLPFEAQTGWLKIGWAVNADYLDATFTGDTPLLAHHIAKNKARTNALLAAAGVPVPPQRVATSFEAVQQAAAELGWPVVVKPIAEDLSRGVVTGIRTEDELADAFEKAVQHGATVVVEKHVEGDCYRLLVVHARLLAAVRKAPAAVTGDGTHSIAELIEIANTADPRRQTYLKPLALDEEGLAYIGEQGLDADSVPQRGRSVAFGHLTFRRIGGSTEDVWESVHPDNALLAKRVADISLLDVAGVDILTTDIGRSWRETGAVVCEVNSQPALMPHWIAQPEREIHGEILDILFAGRPAEIPTAAVIGEGGAAAAALLHRIWTASGTVAGLASTRGVLLGSEAISTDDAADRAGVRVVLNNPGVEAAVFELSAPRLLESGHGCDRYQVAAVLSASAEDAESAASVLETAREAVVLNADDPGCLAIRSRARAARQILVAADPATVAEHRRSAGLAVFPAAPDRRGIVITEGDAELARIELRDPETDLAAARCAVALAWAQGIDPATIAAAL